MGFRLMMCRLLRRWMRSSVEGDLDYGGWWMVDYLEVDMYVLTVFPMSV